jgi:anti-sigma regulatory factor (Ser/Thr protein kinase)
MAAWHTRNEATPGYLPGADAILPRTIRPEARRVIESAGAACIADEALLALTEIVTNTLRYGQGATITVRVVASPSLVTVECGDGTPVPNLRHLLHEPAPDDEGGRGLAMVDLLADRWGFTPDGRVWAAFCTAS